jgi:hypothetical protein
MDAPLSPQTPPAAREDIDLSKQTLVILVLLSCTISIVGVVAMAYQVATAQSAPTIGENNPVAYGEASFTIGSAGSGSSNVGRTMGTGYASFNIQPKG